MPQDNPQAYGSMPMPQQAGAGFAQVAPEATVPLHQQYAERLNMDTVQANMDLRKAQLRAFIAKLRHQMHMAGSLGAGYLEQGKSEAVQSTTKKKEQMR